ncbi:metal-dependent hydrolase [uncultured Mitsuokella sp.]|uniref:metal-dependent hydrolase n=1 Tax=uncultured Mitsuokella sp. TaxID=453120 RepID=UPI0026705DBE|nr:metal-dependent hydrolase [uncultured Mitsuokella sp.]
MKWVDHQVLTGVIVYAATDDLLLTVYSMAGAIFPDKVEGSPRAGHYWSWRSRHRGWSHWSVLYLGIIFFLSHLEEMQLTSLPTADLVTIGTYICIGALLHIAEDAVCGKVPFLTPYHKVGIRLFKVGSVTEYLFTIAAVLLCYGLRTHFSFLQ